MKIRDKAKELLTGAKFVKLSIEDAIAFECERDYSWLELWKSAIQEESDGKIASAENNYLLAFNAAEKNGNVDLSIILIATLLGDFYQKQSRFVEAETFYKRALAAQEHCDQTSHTLPSFPGLTHSENAQIQKLFTVNAGIVRLLMPNQENQKIFLLDSYAALLRKTNRRKEAEVLEKKSELLRLAK